MQTTATDFKANLGKYLALASFEDVHITKNGADIAVLVAPKAKQSWVDDISGIISESSDDLKQIKAERLAQKNESLN